MPEASGINLSWWITVVELPMLAALFWLIWHVRQESEEAPQPSPHFSYSEINALPLNGQQAVTAISALWLRRSTAFRWLQQPIGRHLMIDVVEQVIERHPEVKMRGSLSLPASYRNTCQE